MALPKIALQILSSFKFETGHAITNISALQSGLNGVSSAAQQVQNDFRALTTTSVMGFTGAYGGVLGVIKQAVNANEQFYQSTRKLATLTTGSNTKLMLQKGPMDKMGTLSKDTTFFNDFENSMKNAAVQIGRVAEEASKFGIDAGQFMSAFTNLNAILLPKGAAGVNYQQSRSLARNAMLGASVLGLEDWQVRDRITSLVAGDVQNPQQLLFRRLKQETEAFKGVSLSQFNTMSMKKRVETINKAFDQFLNKPGVLESHLKSLSAQMIILKNRTIGLDSVFKEFGVSIREIAIEGLMELNKWIGTKLKNSIDLVAKSMVGQIKSLKDIEEMYIQLDKLANVSRSFSAAKSISMITFVLFEIGLLLKMFVGTGNIVKGIGIAFGGFNKVLMATLGVSLKLGPVIAFVVGGLLKFLKWFTFFMGLFAVIDSAKAQAKVADMKAMGNNIENVTRKLLFIKSWVEGIMQPIAAFVDYLGGLISPIFQKTTWIELGYEFLKMINITDTVTKGVGVLNGIFIIFQSVIVKVVETLKNALTSFMSISDVGFAGAFGSFIEKQKKLSTDLAKFFESEDQKFWDALHKKQVSDLTNVQQNVVNVAKVEIRNQFKENLEPDRVAVAIKDVFQKSINAQIDTTSRPQTFTGSADFRGL